MTKAHTVLLRRAVTLSPLRRLAEINNLVHTSICSFGIHYLVVSPVGIYALHFTARG